MSKELLFSVAAADCKFDYFRGTGPGGQKRNKTESGVRCTHIASGAVGESDETRSQHENKKKAFVKMAKSATFRAWHLIEIARRSGLLTDIEKTVDNMMKNVKVETYSVEDRKWVEYMND